LYEAQVIALKGKYEAERDALLTELDEDQRRENAIGSDRLQIARLRHADETPVQMDENGARKPRKGSTR
jgi:hypothetical protein